MGCHARNVVFWHIWSRTLSDMFRKLLNMCVCVCACVRKPVRVCVCFGLQGRIILVSQTCVWTKISLFLTKAQVVRLSKSCMNSDTAKFAPLTNLHGSSKFLNSEVHTSPEGTFWNCRTFTPHIVQKEHNWTQKLKVHFILFSGNVYNMDPTVLSGGDICRGHVSPENDTPWWAGTSAQISSFKITTFQVSVSPNIVPPHFSLCLPQRHSSRQNLTSCICFVSFIFVCFFHLLYPHLYFMFWRMIVETPALNMHGFLFGSSSVNSWTRSDKFMLLQCC